MRNGLLVSLATALAGAGLAQAEPPATLGTPVRATLGAPVPSLQLTSFQAAPPLVVASSPGGPAATVGRPMGAPAPSFRAAAPDDPCGPMPACCQPPCCPPPCCDPMPACCEPAHGCGEPGCGGCCPHNCLWFSAEYLRWWVKDSPVPVPLVTSGTLAGAPPGAIGQPGTTVLIGNEDISNGSRSGARFTGGFWFDPDHIIGLEGSYFFLANQTVTRLAGTSGGVGIPALFVPFFNVVSNLEDTLPNNLPFGVGGGGLGVVSNNSLALSTSLHGAELNGIVHMGYLWGWRIDLLAGGRYLDLHETLTFATNSTAPALGIVYNTTDQFDARNRFFGGQVGLRGEINWDNWFITATGKIAGGRMNEVVNINGSTTTNTFPGFGPNFPGGIFAQQDNSGPHSRSRFAVVPEVSVNVGYQVTDWARLFAGYTFLYASDVARPGPQIDRGINPARALGTPGPGPARPSFAFHDTSFWVQGVSFGLLLQY